MKFLLSTLMLFISVAPVLAHAQGDHFDSLVNDLYKLREKSLAAAMIEEKQFLQNHPTDFVAKVLNYSDDCDVKSKSKQSDACWWYKKNPNSCVYARAQILQLDTGDARESAERARIFTELDKSNSDLFREVYLSQESVVLDLNSLDPRYIKIEPKIDFARATAPTKILVEYQGREITSALNSNVDYERIRNGWRLIYKEHCQGSKEDF